jgi:hypothetical protein
MQQRLRLAHWEVEPLFTPLLLKSHRPLILGWPGYAGLPGHAPPGRPVRWAVTAGDVQDTSLNLQAHPFAEEEPFEQVSAFLGHKPANNLRPMIGAGVSQQVVHRPGHADA